MDRHSRWRGSGLNKPLDSGLRRAATGFLGGSFPTPLYHLRPVGVPSRRIQDFLSINDEGGWRGLRLKVARLPECVLSPHRHSSESWNPGGEAGMVN